MLPPGHLFHTDRVPRGELGGCSPGHPTFHPTVLMRDYARHFMRVGADETMIFTAYPIAKTKCRGCTWGVERCPRCPVDVGKCWGCENAADYKLISELESTLCCRACCDRMFAAGMLLPPPTTA